MKVLVLLERRILLFLASVLSVITSLIPAPIRLKQRSGKMALQEIIVFVAIFYVGGLLGDAILDWIGVTGAESTVYSIIFLAVPGIVVYFIWKKWGKQLAD